MLPFVTTAPLVFGLLAFGGARQGSSRAATNSVPPVRTLRFAWAAANLALEPPYDTVQLQAIARTATGAVVPLPISYTSADREITVSSTGLVTARALTTARHFAHVIASVTHDGRTLTDTAVIQVTKRPLPAPLATLSIQPQPGGLTSARGNLGMLQIAAPKIGRFPFFATMATGHPATDTICNGRECRYPLVVHFTSSDPSIAYIDEPASFHALRVGHVVLTISTIAYGVRKVDSLPFTIDYNTSTTVDLYIGGVHPPVIAVRPNPAWGKELNIPPYGEGLHVLVSNHTGEPVEVSLPDPTRGARFVTRKDIFHEVPLSKVRDTLSARGDAWVVVVLDSAGTHVLQYRSLRSGAAHSDTITVLPTP